MNTKIDEIELKEEKDIKNSYLLIKNIHIEKECYETKVFEEIKNDNLLKYTLSYEEGKNILKYDIKNYMSLNEYLKVNKLKKKDVIFIIKSIYNLLCSIENYLLSENSILLDTKSMMLEKREHEVLLKFCFIPGMESDFSYELSKFLVRMLRHIDTEDTDVLNLSYNLFIRSSKKNYSINDLMEVIEESTLHEIDDEMLYYEKNLSENNDENYVEGLDINMDTNILNENRDIDNKKVENKCCIKENVNTFQKCEVNSTNDYNLEIDDDTKKELNLSMFKKIDKTNEKIEQKKKILLNANFKLSKAIWPILAILVPLLSYLILGAKFFQKNYLIFAFYEIIIVLIMSLNALVDNIFN